ncbi:hypothetical protein B7494_g8178 [Chlorociboria aeruginascens]|nr:hypothetical protein B7494_g8178 [Chlorociboria aeruginascens]
MTSTDNESQLGYLSGATPAKGHPYLRVLMNTPSDAQYNIRVAQIPRADRISINGVDYVRLASFRSKRLSKLKKFAWYWNPKHCEELIRTSKGTNQKGTQQRNTLHWRCLHCDEIQEARNGSSGKSDYLAQFHGVTKLYDKPQNIFDRTTEKLPSESIRQNEAYVSLPNTINRNQFTKALITFLVICPSISLVANDLFISLLQSICPFTTLSLPPADILQRMIIGTFELRKAGIKIQLRDSILIAIRQLHGACSSENQAEIILQVIEEFGLKERIGYFVTDNTTISDAAIEAILRRCYPYLDEEHRCKRCLPCLGHVINLAAKTLFYGMEFDAFEAEATSVKDQSDVTKEL